MRLSCQAINMNLTYQIKLTGWATRKYIKYYIKLFVIERDFG